MPGRPEKPHRIRVRVLDNVTRDPNKLKGKLVPHVDVVDVGKGLEFVVCAVKAAHLDQVRDRLGAAGLEEVQGGDTTVAAMQQPRRPEPRPGDRPGVNRQGGTSSRGDQPVRGPVPDPLPQSPLPGKPYGFVALPDPLTTQDPVWHDGKSSQGRLSGEIRFEIKTLTPLLVGWERRLLGQDHDEPWPLPDTLAGVGQLAHKKSVLCPLRAPWGQRPVIVPGDSIKGLLRHELGALLGAPMERVAERSYSYRPNAMFAWDQQLVPRLARVPADGVEMMPLDEMHSIRVPIRLELLPTGLKYDKQRALKIGFYRFDDGNGARYRGGQGAGVMLNSRRNLHHSVTANPSAPTERVPVPEKVQRGYMATIRHLTDPTHGHFSERHPDVPQRPHVQHSVNGDAARERILQAAAHVVFQPGDLVWVEWDTSNNCIVSLGWHYYYRWAYKDSVRRRGDGSERSGLFPLEGERSSDHEGAPCGLSAVRRLFGYTGDNAGSAGIGKDDHAQLMGRVSVNAALEVVGPNDTDERRFLPPTFLRELGMPRPSAVEHYLQQPHHPGARPTDRATLVTYGDADGYDEPGELAGRKFYLDRMDAYTGAPWKDDSPANRDNERSTLALEASLPGRSFRFTVRFRDLDDAEVAAIAVALCPDQFRAVLGGNHPDGYCSKLGHARPLGWGSVRIEARSLLLLDATEDVPALNAEPDIETWVKGRHRPTSTQGAWLGIHRCRHPHAADYPQAPDNRGTRNIYTFHTRLRGEHSRARRFTRSAR